MYGFLAILQVIFKITTGQKLQVRQNIRDKYGIEKKQPTKKSDKQTAAMMEELRKEYGMDDEDAKELQNKMDKVIQLFQCYL